MTTEVSKTDPKQQGLKLNLDFFHRRQILQVSKTDPKQQGMKRTSTRCDTAPPSPVSKTDPKQQGLKLTRLSLSGVSQPPSQRLIQNNKD